MLNPNLNQNQLLQSALQHHQSGRLQQAEGLYREILRQNPRHADALRLLGGLANQVGRHDIAVELIRQAIAVHPVSAEAFNDLGIALKDDGRLHEAIVVYRQAIALRNNFPEAFSNLGNALRSTGQLDEAIEAFRRSIALKPDHPQVHANLGNALQDQGRLDEAIAEFHQSLGLRPDSPEVYYNLGRALADKGQLDESIAAYRQAIALRENYPAAHNNLGIVLNDAGQRAAAAAAYRHAIALKPDFTDAHSNLVYALHFRPGCNGGKIAEELRRWKEKHADPLAKFIQPHSNDRDPDRRLRIGYISPDFRQHPVGRFLQPLFAHHDKSQVEIFAYANQVSSDAITVQLRSFTHGWRSIAGFSDAQTADLIRQDRIDILVDLTMHTANSRLLVFAYKPAPVQVTYLAYCSSTGMATIDYRLSDPYLDPPGMDESIYSERTIRLPETYWCYQPTLATPEVGPLPALPQGFITFGCLNNFCKVSEPALAVWAAILRATPNARLLLHAHEGSHRQRVRERFIKEGINPDRFHFVGKLPVLDYLGTYGQIDIGLDTFPYGGGTTTCDALWMGVPVVSLLGEMAVGRGGLSILSNVGLPELVARTEEDYVRLAVKLASDLPRLADLRSTLRPRMKQSPLMDAPRFARSIELAFRQMWRDWCGKP